VLPTTGWIPGFSACSEHHAWHPYRAGCIVISENPQGLAIHMGSVGYKSHDPCFHVFHMEGRVITFVAHCTLQSVSSDIKLRKKKTKRKGIIMGSRGL